MTYRSDSPVYQEEYDQGEGEEQGAQGFSGWAMVLIGLVCGLLVHLGYPAAVVPAVLALVIYYRMEAF